MAEILFEYVQLGNSMKVIAIDTNTSTEVCVVTPINISQQQMQQLALQKLQYVMNKEAEI